MTLLSGLICYLLGHVFDDLDIRETPQARVYTVIGSCARCSTQMFMVCDLRNEDPQEADTVDERSPTRRKT